MMIDGIKYRATRRSKIALYDYKTFRAGNIPYAPKEEPVELEVVSDKFGVQNFLARLSRDEQATSAVVCAGNSGLPGGAVGAHINVHKDITTCDELKLAPESMGGTYGTQEEDVVKNWLLSEHAKRNTSLLESMNEFFHMYGMVDYQGHDKTRVTKTKQGVNYTNLKDSDPNIIKHLLKNSFPYTRLYAEALVVRNTYLRPKIGRKPDIYKEDEFVLTNLVFVAGPNVGAWGKNENSTTRRTYNKFLALNETAFLDGVKWTYFAALHSIAMEGKRIALLPWISGALYAGRYIDTYGVNSDGSMMQDVINKVLDMDCDIQNERSILRCAFDRVVVVHTGTANPNRNPLASGRQVGADPRAVKQNCICM